MEWADWIRGKESGTQGTVDQDSKNYISIKSGMTVNGNMRHSRGTIASSNFESGTAGYSLDAATGNIETNSDLVCGNIHVKAAIDDVNISGASGNAIIGVSTSGQHLAFDANEIMSKSDATTAGTLYLQHNGGTLVVGAGAVGTFRVGSDDGTTHKSVASFSHGSHGTPSITFNSDLDTGFFRESSNTIGSTGNFTMSKDGSSATLTVSTFADAPGTESIIVLRSADNTMASPALRDSGDNLGEIHFSGHDGTDYAVGAKISVAASAATGDNDMGATIKLQTTPDGSQTPTTRLAVDHAGHVFITAASSDSTVDLDGVSGDLLVGTVDGGDMHIAMSGQIIQCKNNATTAGNLYLNNTGGNVSIGNSSSSIQLNGPTFLANKVRTGASSFTVEPWTNSTIMLGTYGSIGTQGSYRTSMAWNFERGVDSGSGSPWEHLDINSYPQAGAVEIGNSGIVFRFQDDYETNHTNIPNDVLIMDADALYPTDTNVTDLGTSSKKFQIVYGNYYYATQGSASYPAYVFDGDNNTGMYSAGSDSISWATAGVSRMRLYSGGALRVGSGSGDFQMHGANGTESFRAVTSVVRAANIVNLTTAVAANVRIASTNNSMYMNTSSVRYKTNVEDLEDTYADKVLNLRPVWYRSLCKDDPDEHSYYGLIAEEVADIEPRLVHYGPKDDCTCPPEEDDPDHVEHHVEGCLIPESVQYDRLVPHLINLAKRQDATIKGIEARLASLEG